MKSRNVLRKIACLLVIVLLLGCFSGCKSVEDDNAAGGVVDMNGVAGDEIEVDIPDAPVKDDDSNDGQTNTPAGNDQQDDQTETPDDTRKDDQTETPDDTQQDDQTDDTQTDDKEEEPNYEDLFKEEEVVKPAYDESKELVIVSYNIKCAMYSTTIDQVVSQIQAANADIVGFQEVDLYKSRSKNIDQIATIADKAGFPYYYFEPVIVTGKPHEKADPNVKADAYGHAIMSKYPIKKSEIVWPNAQTDVKDGEVRNFGRHEIDVDGTTIVFYNGHLDFNKGREQYFEVQENYMANDEYAICVGDFNEKYADFGVYFDSDKFYSFAFGEDCKNIITRGESKNQLIDHIIVTKDKFVWKDGGLGNGLYQTEHNGASDHHMLYCHLNIIK